MEKKYTKKDFLEMIQFIDSKHDKDWELIDSKEDETGVVNERTFKKEHNKMEYVKLICSRLRVRCEDIMESILNKSIMDKIIPVETAPPVFIERERRSDLILKEFVKGTLLMSAREFLCRRRWMGGISHFYHSAKSVDHVEFPAKKKPIRVYVEVIRKFEKHPENEDHSCLTIIGHLNWRGWMGVKSKLQSHRFMNMKKQLESEVSRMKKVKGMLGKEKMEKEKWIEVNRLSDFIDEEEEQQEKDPRDKIGGYTPPTVQKISSEKEPSAPESDFNERKEET